MRFFQSLLRFMLKFAPNLVSQSKSFEVTMLKNIFPHLLLRFYLHMAFFTSHLVLILHNRMGWLRGRTVTLLRQLVFFFSTGICLFVFGIMLFSYCAILSIACHRLFYMIKSHFLFCSLMTLFMFSRLEFLGAFVLSVIFLQG